jgi:hypothetical protein
MTAGTTSSDLPRIGHILHYVYLFLHESQTRDEGIKTRPVVVIDVDPQSRRIAVLALTTKGERYPGTIALPDDVARVAGLQRKAAALYTEYNIFTWLGYDIRPVADGFIAGRLPPGFTAKLRALTLENATAIDRD